MNRQQKYEQRQRAAGKKTVSARLSADEASAIQTAGGATAVLREQAAIQAAIQRHGAKAVHDAAFARMQSDMNALAYFGIEAPTLATAWRASVAAFRALSPEEQAQGAREAEEALERIAQALPPASRDSNRGGARERE